MKIFYCYCENLCHYAFLSKLKNTDYVSLQNEHNQACLAGFSEACSCCMQLYVYDDDDDDDY